MVCRVSSEVSQRFVAERVAFSGADKKLNLEGKSTEELEEILAGLIQKVRERTPSVESSGHLNKPM